MVMSCQYQIESLCENIRDANERIEELAQEGYPQVTLLKQIKRVGMLIALTWPSHGRRSHSLTFDESTEVFRRLGGLLERETKR
jgi:hypothetical protein